jgi:ABC-type transport system involved in cytochrome c biogenesis permease subunit
MANQASGYTRNLDRISGAALAAATLAALALYFLFYAPGIAQGVQAGTWPEDEVLWLQIHIAVYWISYILFLTGLVLAVIYFFAKGRPRFPWVETASVIATFLAIAGLITGMLFARPAWGVWWVWDAKHAFVLLATLVLLGIAPLAALNRLFANPLHRNLALIVPLFIAVTLCASSLLVGILFTRIIHPAWLLGELLR